MATLDVGPQRPIAVASLFAPRHGAVWAQNAFSVGDQQKKGARHGTDPQLVGFERWVVAWMAETLPLSHARCTAEDCGGSSRLCGLGGSEVSDNPRPAG